MMKYVSKRVQIRKTVMRGDGIEKVKKVEAEHESKVGNME